jgi:hypothetical protein
MSVSTDTVVSNLIGGAITLAVAAVFFWIQERRARKSFDLLCRFLENLAANSAGGDLKFKRDATGNPTAVIVEAAIGFGGAVFVGFAPTVTTTGPAGTSTKQVQEPGSTL